MFTRLRPEVNQWWCRFGIAILDTIFASSREICLRMTTDDASSNSNTARLRINGLIPSRKDLRRLFHSPIVLGSYIKILRWLACALALVLIAATRGRMGYREEVDTVFDEAAAVR